jgi:Flp pilus assembly protein TadG
VRNASEQRGAAAVEFALLVPFLCLLLFGVVDFGYMLNRTTLVSNASRDGHHL